MFISFNNPQGGGNDLRATTLAVGEEGGGNQPPPQFTTLAVGEEGGGNQPPPQFTTLAVGEEGGGNQPPDVTTAAVGEEGGGGGYQPPQPIGPPEFTTLAVGEEGGGGDYPFLPFGVQTQDVHQVLQNADRGGGYNNGPDGQLTRDELGNYTNQLNLQLSFMRMFNQFFPFMGLDQQIQQMEQQLRTAEFMQNNFSGIADADGNEGSMTHYDVFRTSINDNNPNDISFRDVNNIRPYELPYQATTRALGEEGGGV